MNKNEKLKKESVGAVASVPEETVETTDEFDVKDPEVFRPIELPLVITPKKGQDWKNPEQAAYAKTLNAYAYKNPTKWATRKEVELKRLAEIGNNPSKYQVYAGEPVGGSNLKVGGNTLSS